MPFRPGPMAFVSPFDENPSDTVPYNYTISGQTLDGAGAPLAGCAVHLFYTDIVSNRFVRSGGFIPDLTDTSDIEVAETLSDANGNYSFYVDEPTAAPSTYYIVAYLPGSPDRAGTTVNTLVGI